MKLSIIMPCFNVENTLSRALDSIFMQRSTFDYEVLIINDASTDHTLEIAENYQQTHGHIRIFNNAENSGNARSFFVGLSNARGDYFCVLDGDDYYTIPNKLQRQVDFLDKDVDQEYVGTATYYILDLGDGKVNVPARSNKREFNYVDFLTQNSGYFHTATYVYRNIFRGNVPEYFNMTLYRGDTPRTTFHLMYSGKKIRILDFVGSAYTFEHNGIWSGLQEKQQFEYQINYQSQHKENVSTSFEREAADRLLAFNKSKLNTATNQVRRYPEMTIEDCLSNIRKYVSQFAFAEKDFVLREAFCSDYMDTLCASLGYIQRIHHPEQRQNASDINNICIINGVLNPQGGGIFAEILELIRAYHNKKVFLFVTNMDEVPQNTLNILNQYSNLTLVCPPKDANSKLTYFSDKLVEISPYRAYYYCSHNDVYGPALMQAGVCENICLFSFDHGYLCGITNPNIDTIIAKRPADFTLLSKRFGSRVIYIPTWDEGAKGCGDLQYVPFANHDRLITASGAARFYKINGGPPYRYIDYVLALLQKTHGIHYHFGTLPDDVKEELCCRLSAAGLPASAFVNIEWSNNIPRDLLNYHVDIFIEPFPVVSYKLTLEVLSVGIPVFAYDSVKRMSITDFIPSNSLRWRNQGEFIEKLSGLTYKDLAAMSEDARSYFYRNHYSETVLPYLLNNKSFMEPNPVAFADDEIHDIMECLRLFGNNYRVLIQNDVSTALKTQSLRSGPAQDSFDDAGEQLRKIYASASYRVGYVVMWIPRTLKASKKLLENNSFLQTLKILWTTDYLSMEGENEEQTLETVLHSRTYRVGHALLTPLRSIRYHKCIVPKRSKRKKEDERWNRLLWQTKIIGQQIHEYQTQNETMLALLQESRDKNLELKRLNAELKAQNAELIKSLDEKLTAQNNGVIAKLQDLNGWLEDTSAIQEKQIGQLLVQQRDLFGKVEHRLKERMESSHTETINAISKTVFRNVLEHLDYHLVEHCNLNCRSCSTFSPIAEETFASPDAFERDLIALNNIIGDRVSQIHLLGGEPLLHKRADAFAVIARKVFPHARIDYTTNGILVRKMPDSFWNVLRTNDVAIKFTRYPINVDYEELIAYVKAKGVHVFSAGGEKPIECFRRIPMNPKGTFNMHGAYVQCPYVDCAQLRNGRLYRCPACGFSDILNKKMKEEGIQQQFSISSNDFIDLHTATSAHDIFAFCSSATPFCSFCDLAHMDSKVPWKISDRDIREWVDL